MVIKIGGSLLRDGIDESLIKSICEFRQDDSIIVHGGGPTVSNLCKDLGIEPRFVISPEGIRSRLTDLPTMKAYLMAMRGRINAEIVIAMQRYGVKSFGMSGIDGPTLLAERKKRLLIINARGRKMFIDGGYTGKIVQVNISLMAELLQWRFTPVVAPIAMSLENEPLNVDGDRAASAISGALKADRLILLTDVDGVMMGGEFLREMKLNELNLLLRKVGNGMDKKLIAAKEALEAGTKEVIISKGTLADPLRNAIDSDNKTVITA